MSLAYIITESTLDKEILKKLLPEHLVPETQFVAASGKYGAQSLASTILAIKLLPVALIIDADTEDEQRIREQSTLLHQLLHQSSPGIPFEIFMAIPELEAIFYEDRSLIEKIVERRFTDVEWRLARSHPKAFLESVLGKHPTWLEKISTSLTEENIHTLQQHSLIKKLINFLSQTAPTPSHL